MRKKSGTPPEQIDNSRRRILQGAASVPMVVTLSNASAQAATSFGMCRTDINPEATPPLDVATECVADAIPSGSTPFLHKGAGTALREINGDILAPDPNNQCIAYIRQDGSYYFDSTTPAGTGGVSVTASCYTSFIPT